MKEIVRKVIFLLWMILIFLFFVSCSSSRSVVPSETKTRIEYRDKVKRDTVHVLDSVFVERRADTVYISKYRQQYVERVRVDTVIVCQRDTIWQVEEVIKTTEMTRYESICLAVGKVTFWILILLLLIGIGYVIKKFV